MSDIEREVHAVAQRAKDAAADLAPLSRAVKDQALLAIADALVKRADEITAANAQDVERARRDGTSPAMIDRLTLNPARIEAIADAVREIVELPDPVGESVRGSILPNGLDLRQIRVPLGVIGIIYEGRPNVTADAAALCLKSGNAALLRGSSSAYDSNTAIVGVLRDALEGTGVPVDAVQMVPGRTRESSTALMRARGLVDVLIPRGGGSLIQAVVRDSTVPVIETGEGLCHVYVDADADLDKALAIAVNAKAQRCSVCNSAETLLVHEAVADAFLPRVLASSPRPRSPCTVTTAFRRSPPRTRPVPRWSRPPRRTGPPSTCPWTWPCGSSRTWTPRSRTSGSTPPSTPRRSSPTRSAPPGTSCPGWTRPR